MFTNLKTMNRGLLILTSALALSACSGLGNRVDPTGQYLEIEDDRIAEAALEGRNFDSAIRIYKARLKAQPEDPQRHLDLANALMSAGALDEASVYFRKAQKQMNWAAEPWVGLGRLSLHRGRPAEAKQYFTAAVARVPNNYEANNGLAVALDNLGQHADAQTIYQSLLRAHPDDLKVRTNHALSMALGGNPRRAVNYLLGFVSSPSAPQQARQNLAIAYALSGDMNKAREIMELDLPREAIDNNLAFLRQVKQGGQAITAASIHQMFSN